MKIMVVIFCKMSYSDHNIQIVDNVFAGTSAPPEPKFTHSKFHNTGNVQLVYAYPVQSTHIPHGYLSKENIDNVVQSATPVPSAPINPNYSTYESSVPHLQANYEVFVRLLMENGFTRELAAFLAVENAKFKKSFYVLDTSGSMITNDGKIFDQGYVKHCSRLVEMRRFAIPAYSILSKSNISAKFINTQGYAIDLREQDHSDVMFDNFVGKADGSTPLRSILSSIRDEIRRSIESSRTIPIGMNSYTTNDRNIASIVDGREFFISIVTDGNSTDGSITDIIKELHSYGARILIRLCTDDESVVNYWNDIDKDLEIRLDIVDSYVDEIKEVMQHNRRLKYTKQVHFMRELGVTDHRLDHIDERPLSTNDINYFNRLIGSTNRQNYLEQSMCVMS